MSSYEPLLPDGISSRYNIDIVDNKNKKLTDNIHINEVENIVKYLETQNIIPNDTNKKRNLKVTLVGEHQYRLKIGNSQFYVASVGNTQEADSKEVTVIKEKILQNKFFKLFHKVFSTIKHLFYDKEKFPPKGQRLPSQIIKQDFRTLRKSLSAGQSLLSKDRAGDLNQKLTQTLDNTKTIEVALLSKDPSKEILHLSHEWAGKIKGMANGEEFIFATGYINSEENLQPVMVRYYKVNNEFFVDIYCDSPEAGKKINPLQTRKIEMSRNVLTDNFIHPFLNLLLPSDPQKGLPAFAKKDETFSEIVEEKKREDLNSLGVALPPANKEKTPAQAMTFDRLINLLNIETNEEDQPLFSFPKQAIPGPAAMREQDIQDDGAGVGFDLYDEVELPLAENARVQNPTDSKPTITASKTAEQRHIKWMDSLLTEENQKLTSFEKSSLLYVMTETSVKRQMDQITAKTPLIEQLRIYKDCLAQIKHASTKIAPAIIGDPKATILVPPRLLALQEKCELKIAGLGEGIRKTSLEGNMAALNRPTATTIPISLAPLSDISVQKTKATYSIGTLDVSQAEAHWNEEYPKLQSSIAHYEQPSIQKEKAIAEINSVLATTKSALEKADPLGKLAEVTKLEAELDTLINDNQFKEISERLLALVDDAALEKFFRAMSNKHFTRTAFDTSIKDISIYIKNFKTTATRLVISPLLLPKVSPGEYNGLIHMIDPQTVFPDEYMPLVNLFRASNQLSNLLTADQRKEYTAEQMDNDYNDALREATQADLIDKLSALEQSLYVIADTELHHEIKDLLEDFRKNHTQYSPAEYSNFLEKSKQIGKKLDSLPPLELQYEKFSDPSQHNQLLDHLKALSKMPIIRFSTIHQNLQQFLVDFERVKDTEDPAQLQELVEKAKVIHEGLINLPRDDTVERFRKLETFSNLAALNMPSNELLENLVIEKEEDLDDLPPLEAVENINQLSTSIVNSVATLANESAAIFKSAAQVQDKAAMKRGYDQAITLLKTIPPMGTERVTGVASPWSNLSREEVAIATNALDTLEKIVWEYYMRLGVPGAPGDVSLLQIKTQAIRLGLMRREVQFVQNSVQELLQSASHSTDPGTVTKARKILESLNILAGQDPIPAQIKIDFSQLSLGHLEVLLTDIKDLNGSEDIPVEMLIVDRYTLPLYEYNFNFTQDLTNLNSLGENAQRDLTATFHYLIQDLHYGAGDFIWRNQNIDVSYRTHRNFTLFHVNEKPVNSQVSLNEKVFSGVIPEGSKGAEWSKRLLSSFIYYKTVSDPNFTLKDPNQKKSFLETHPDSILREGEVEIHHGKTPTITNTRGDTIAEVHVQGNGVTNQRQVHLPVMFHYESDLAPFLIDRRHHGTFSGWTEYAEQQSTKSPTALPSDTLANLLSIRQIVGDTDRMYGTSYGSSTLPNAIDYLCHIENVATLNNDYVQKFLLESMFGPFVAQEGLVEHLPHIVNAMDPLEKCMSYCLENGKVAEMAFLITVMEKLLEQVNFALEDVEKRGIAGSSYTMLPNWKGRVHTAHGLNIVMARKYGDLSKTDFDDITTAKMLPEEYSHPIVAHALKLGILRDRLLGNINGMGTTLIEAFKESYFERSQDDNVWKIDRFALPGQVLVYLNLVEEYQRFLSEDGMEGGLSKLKDDATPHDLSIMLSAWNTLANQKNPAFNTVRNQNAVTWLEKNVGEYLEAHLNDDEVQAELTNTYLRLTPNVSSGELTNLQPWTFKPPGIYSTVDHLNRQLTLDLSRSPSTFLKGEFIEEVEEKPRKIPYHLLSRKDVKQALGDVNITTLSSSEGKQTVFKWSHDGQEFTLRELESGDPKSRIEITRKIEGKEYIFQTVSLDAEASSTMAGKILSEYGVWRSTNSQNTFVFTQGMENPTEAESFRLDMNAENTAGRLVSMDTKNLVGGSPVSKASPLLFASASNTIVIYDNSSASELRLLNTPLKFTKKAAEKQWECTLNGTAIGKLGLPARENEIFCENNFGSHWDQYIVPLETESGLSKFVLIPYRQSYDAVRKGVYPDQTSLSEVAKPEVITINKDGTLQCSLTASLYLANQMLLEANNTKDASLSRNYCLKAEKLLTKITQENPPTSPEERAQLFKMLSDIEKQIPITLPKMPSKSVLSLALKLRLQIHRLQEGFGASSVMKFTPAEKYESLETTFKLTEAYQQIKPSTNKTTPSQLLRAEFDLTPEENAKLLETVGVFMKNLLTGVEGSGNYFSTVFDSKPPTSIPVPTDLSPEFLLALIRAAKKPENIPPLALTHRTNPLLIHELVENFWSYFFVIKNNKLSPSDLLILMEPSTLPMDITPEEKDRLKNIDLQTRQFLLTYAEMQTTVLSKDPKTTMEESLKKAKKEFDDSMSSPATKEMLDKMKSNAHPLAGLIDRFTSEMKNLKVETTTQKVGEKDVTVVDINALVKQVNSLKTAIYNVRSEVYRTKEAAKNFLSDLTTAYNHLDNEKQTISKQLERLQNSLNISTDEETKKDLEIQIEEYKENLKKVEGKIDELNASSNQDPISNKSVSKKEILKNIQSYQKNIQTLEDTYTTIKLQEEGIEKFLDKAKSSQIALLKLAQIEVIFDQIENDNFVTDPHFKMPSGDSEKALAKEFLREMKDNPQVFQEDKIGVIRWAINELGLIRGAKFLWNMYKIDQSGVTETAEKFTTALAGILVTSNALMDEKHVEANRSSQTPLSLNPIEDFDEALASSYLNDTEIEQFKEKLASTPKNERKAFLKELSNVMKVSEKMASEMMQTSNAIQSINSNSSQIRRNTVPKQMNAIPFPNTAQKLRMTEAQLKEFTSLFPSTVKPSKILELIEIFSQDKSLEAMIAEIPSTYWTEDLTPYILGIRDMRSSLGKEQIKEIAAIGRSNIADLLEGFQTIYKQWQEQQHKNLIQNLIKETVPTSSESSDSQYSKDLTTALNNLEDNNPLPINNVITAASLPKVYEKFQNLVLTKEQTLTSLSADAIQTIKSCPFQNLPKELQQLRALKATDEEILQQALYLNSRNKLSNLPELENQLIHYCVESAALKTLVSGQNNAKASLTRLVELAQLRKELSTFQPQSKDRVAALKKLDALEKEWRAESGRLIDYLDRCQSTLELENIPESLKPHLKTIVYLQHLVGIVLRQDQFENLDTALSQNATVLTLLMGAGKTSTLMPFLLGILLQMGHNVVGVLPREQFGADMKQLDETTRSILQYAGQEFLFARDQLKLPISEATLAVLSQRCASFLESCATQDKYILTTAESKASLDDKIAELEIQQAKLLDKVKNLKPKDEDKKSELFNQIKRTESALGMLYRVQGVFENPMTRVLTDEIDYILRSNYSVNAEMGQKTAPPPLFTQPVHQLFSIIRDSENPAISNLNTLLLSNEQISLNNKESIDMALQAIADEWLQKYGEHLPESFRTKGSNENNQLLNWFSGGPFPELLFRDLDSVSADTLFIARAALHQALRTCLGFKIGLNTNFDPNAEALGVPATQGATNATTKYSDVLMQLCVSQMIATYKPQGEEYVTATASKVIISLRNTKAQLEKDLEETPTKTWLEKEIKLYEEAITNLNSVYEKKNEQQEPMAHNLEGKEPWKVLVRQTFSEALTSSGLVYTSTTQIQRPVQAAFWGSNLIGFTGTATRNISHLVTATGCETAMDNVTKTGKSSTAEVIYRIAASLPQGLDTVLGTYPSDRNQQLGLLIEKAKDKNERFIINQAGICDHITAQELVKKLHTESLRPIVHVDVTTKRKSVWINGNFKELDKLTPKEMKQVEEEGLFYYHTQHTRGTHFSIPIGSEGTIFLSPTVNANDRDQAFYRARKLGVGHTVKPYISEKDNSTFQQEHKLAGNAQLKHLLKKNHEQTYQDEADEAKDAYIIRITAPLVKAGDRIRRRLRTEYAMESPSETRGLAPKLIDEKLKPQHICSEIIDVFQAIYSNDTSTTAYMGSLRSQGKKGLSVDTPDYLRGQITNRQNKLLEIQSGLTNALFNYPPFKEDEKLQSDVKNLLSKLEDTDLSVKDKLDQLNTVARIQRYPLVLFLDAFEELFTAGSELKNEIERIKTQAAKIKTELKPTIATAAQSAQTSESEAEAEEQQEQEIQSTSEEAANNNRDQNGRKFFSAVDDDVFNSIDMEQKNDFRKAIPIAFDVHVRNGKKTFAKIGINLWSDRCVLSERLAAQLKHNPLNLKNVALLFAENDTGDLRIVMCDLLSEGNYILSEHNASQFTQVNPQNRTFKPINFSLFLPAANATGDLELNFLGSARAMKGLKDQVLNDYDESQFYYQAEAFIALLHIGFANMTADQYEVTAAYFAKQSPEIQKDIEDSLKKHLGSVNPELFIRAMQKIKGGAPL
ncbi:MAG: hypothetical protein WC222_01115 [Parachlamydiales bacterium]|jgi:hypothetical protein